MKKKKILGIIIVLSIGLVGLYMYGTNMAVEKISESEQLKVVEDVNNLLNEDGNLTKIKAKLDENKDKLDIKNSSELVNSYIYSLYLEETNVNKQLDSVYGNLIELIKEDVDINNISDINKIENELVKGFLLETKKNSIKLVIDKSTEVPIIIPMVDLESVIKDYEKYMEKSLLNFCEFRIYETKTKIINDENEINYDEIVKRITIIETSLKEDNGTYRTHWEEQKKIYYRYIGIDRSQLPLEDGKYDFKEKYLKDIERLANENKDTEIGQVLTDLSKVIKENENKFNENVDKFLVEIEGKYLQSSEENK